MDRREEIYETALKMFIEDGYDNTPLSKIAKSLNLTKAGLYHYFSSKEELLFTIHTHSVQAGFVSMMDAAEQIECPEERLKFFIQNYTTQTMTKDPSVKISIHEINKLKPAYQKEIKKIWKRTFDLVRGALSELEELGRLKKMNKTFAAFALLGMCTWTLYWFDYDRRESAVELADTLVAIFFSGIMPAE